MIRVFAVFFLSIAGAMACFQPLTPALLATAAAVAFMVCTMLRRND
jgi:hypothetical protein